MNQRGRPAISKEEKEKKGTLRKCRDKPVLQSAPMIGSLPEPPEELTEKGREEWQRIISGLDKTKLLSPTDLGTLKALCLEFERYVKCTLEVRNNPTGPTFAVLDGEGRVKYWALHPMHTAAQQHLKSYNMLCNEFGLSPASRQKIGSVTSEKPVSKAGLLLKSL